MTTTELPVDYTALTPGGIGAGAAIFRRLERGQRKPKWMGIAIGAVLAVSAISVGIALKVMSSPSAPPRAALSQAAPAPEATPAAMPAPAAPATAPAQLRVTHAPVKATRYAVVPIRRAAVSRASSGERTGALIAASPPAATTSSSAPAPAAAPPATTPAPVNPPASSAPMPTTPPPVIASPPESSPPASAPATPPQ